MRLRLTLSTALVLALAGCTFVDVPDAKPTTGRSPTVAEVPAPEETVRGVADPPVVTLDVGTRLHERKLARTDKLPGGIIVPTTNLSAVPITAALQAVLAGTDVSLSWDSSAFDDRLVSVTNLSGPLPQVVDKICASAKVFCSYRGGLLEVKDKETFIVELPVIPSIKDSSKATNSMADMIGSLAGDKVRIDDQGGKLVYTTDVTGHENVGEYLDQLRNGRPLVVMQLYIWEVTLSNDKATGINWSKFELPEIGKGNQKILIDAVTGFTSVANPGVSLGAKLTGNITADGVLKFLSSQGQVQTISNPQLTFVSGSSAEFRVGGQQRYISEVGETTTSVSTSTTGTNTVTTDSLETGLTVTVAGSFESGVISAQMEIEMQDVISLNPTTMKNGTIIDLPETTERKVNTSLRVRPGDNLVLAGLVTSRDKNSKEGVPLPFGMKLSTFRSDELENKELVILVKPSIVLFSDASRAEEGRDPVFRSPVAPQPLPDAVLIDKDGAKQVAVPTGQLFTAPAPTAVQAVPAIPASAPRPLPDGAPVGQGLLQRGFSRAYDEMLQPTSLLAPPAQEESP